MKENESVENSNCCHSGKRGKLIAGFLLVIWIIFSIGYIANDIWSDFKVNMINVALSKGYENAFINIIKVSTDENTKCNKIPIQQDNKIVVELVNIACLQQSNTPDTPVNPMPSDVSPVMPPVQ